MKHFQLLSLAATLPGVYSIAFAGPQPTDTSPERALFGTSPAPTQAPSVPDLLRRQNSDSNVCGWVDNAFESAVTCSVGRTCMLYKSASVGMAGCCAGSDRQNCGWASSCVNFNQYTAGSCGSNCLVNSLVRKCTNSAQPYCITYTYQGENVLDYGCDSISTTYTVRSSVSDVTARVTTSLRLSTVTAAAVVTGTGSTGSSTDNIDTETKAKAVKLAVGVIAGIAIAIVFVIFFIIIGICMCLKRKKKQRQLAQNTQIAAANQANRQSQYQQPPTGVQQPQMQQQSQGYIIPQQQDINHQPNQTTYQLHQQTPSQHNTFSPPIPPQTPQPPINGYFTPPPPLQQHKDTHTSVYEYAVTPISNPSTPAPAYAQPYPAPNAPPMPQQHVPQGIASPVSAITSPVQQFSTPPSVGGAVEVDGGSRPVAPNGQGGHGPRQGQGPVYEMGGK